MYNVYDTLYMYMYMYIVYNIMYNEYTYMLYVHIIHM